MSENENPKAAIEPSKEGRNKDGTFAKGFVSNPAGKPKGTRHRTTLAVEAVLDGEAETITRKAIEVAMEGELTAIRVCLDRIVPARRDVGLEGAAMSAVEAIKTARAAGVQFGIDGDDLVLEASAPPPPAVIDLLSRHKAEVVALLRPAEDGWSAEDWLAFHNDPSAPWEVRCGGAGPWAGSRGYASGERARALGPDNAITASGRIFAR